MNALRQALVDYLAVRRVLGYRLARAEKLLAQFLTYLEDRGENHLTTETALAWATLPAGAHRNWMATRLSVVRRFAAHLRGIDPATEVPPANLLPGRTCRATPYLYSEEDIAALMTAASALRTSHRKATYRTLIALLAVTGMRIGEAIGLDRIDFDAINGLLTIRKGKFGKSRELPLHPSGVVAGEAQRMVGDGDVEVLGDLAAAEHGTDGSADRACSTQRSALALNAGLDGLQIVLGCGEQFVSFAGPLFGKSDVLAHHKALAREVRAFDLVRHHVRTTRSLSTASFIPTRCRQTPPLPRAGVSPKCSQGAPVPEYW